MTRGVLILCEGNFNRGSGDVWFYDTASHAVYPNLYRSQNGSDLGNVVQSYCRVGDKGFISVNNSGKVTVVNHQTFKRISSITGFQSPRYIISTPYPFAYVTDLYSGSISIINTETNTRLPQSIRVSGWTEQGILGGGNILGDPRLFVVSRRAMFDERPGGEYLYTINLADNTVVDSISLGIGGEEVVRDSRQRLWLSFDSIAGNGGKPALVCYDPESRSVVHTQTLSGLKPTRLNLVGDKLFFLHDGISCIQTDLLQSPMVKVLDRKANWTSLKVFSSINGQIQIIACDSRDYISDGRGYHMIYGNGRVAITDSFSVGIIPGNIY